MSDHRRVVWILGAGFSRPLGGPLLTDLLWIESKEVLAAAYNQGTHPHLFGPLADNVQALYQYGVWPSRLHNSAHERLWRDAEEFLDHLDTAATSPYPSASSKRLMLVLREKLGFESFLKQHQPQDLFPNMSRTARRLLAAECSVFLDGGDLHREQWEPYFDWTSKVGQLDTIISFNYDRVVEMLYSTEGSKVSNVGFPLEVAMPGRESPSHPCLLKLHGSVDWVGVLDGAGKIVQVKQGKSDVALTIDDGRSMVVASPGPTKKLTTEKVLWSLWDYARKVVEQADAVVFIGYRFPETDANARRRLLTALRGNGKHDLFVHTVLGPPDLNRSHQVRLEHLLRNALTTTDRKERVHGKSSDKWFHFWEHPLYAQDFFTVVQRDQLFMERPVN